MKKRMKRMMLFMGLVAFALGACAKSGSGTTTTDAGTATPVAQPATAVAKTDLTQVPCKGLESTVSQYVFEETLRKLGKDPSKYQYQNMQPDAAASALKTKDPDTRCIAVWEPFALDAIRARGNVHVVADSRLIPAEVLDLIVIGQAVLDRPKGDQFALALIDTYYRVVRELEDPATSDDAHRRLGKKVTDLDAASMKDVLTRTVLYRQPEWVLELFGGGNPYPFPDGSVGMRLKDTMPKVVGWMRAKGAIKSDPTVGYGSKAVASDAQFRFDPTYLQEYIRTAGQPPATADAGVTDCTLPAFTLAYSEYASWSTFAVAEMEQLVGVEEGKCGPVERARGVDLVLNFMGYDPSIGAYAGGKADAVTITNMDMLVAARADATVVVTATSTSWGADRTIVVDDVELR